VSDKVGKQHLVYDKITLMNNLSYYVSHSRRYTYPDDPGLDDIHIHDNYEIYFHITGNASFFVKNSVYSLRPGDIILSAPGDIHMYIPDDKTEAEHYCLWFDKECGKELLPLLNDGTFVGKISFDNEDYEVLKRIFFKLYNNSDEISSLKKLSDILKLCLMIDEKMGEGISDSSNIPPNVREIVEYIDANKTDISNVGDVAEKFNISISTLNRWFKKYVGLSPQELLNAKRISYAKKLLDEGENVTECSMKAGFSDCSYFISVFKKRFGITPFQYKKNRKGSYRKL